MGPKGEKAKSEKIVRDGYQQGLIYEIAGDTFKKICSDYPEFKTLVYIRAEIRIAYFKHLS